MARHGLPLHQALYQLMPAQQADYLLQAVLHARAVLIGFGHGGFEFDDVLRNAPAMQTTGKQCGTLLATPAPRVAASAVVTAANDWPLL